VKKHPTLILAVVILAVAALLLFTRNNNVKQAQIRLAPDFELVDLHGRIIKLSDYRGHAVVLNFWATSCGGCRVELPWLVNLQKQYRPNGLEILGIAMDEGIGYGYIEQFARERGVNYTIVTGKGKDSVADAYGILGMPSSIYIDPAGQMVAKTEGLPDNADEIEKNIKKILPAAAHATANATGIVLLPQRF